MVIKGRLVSSYFHELNTSFKFLMGRMASRIQQIDVNSQPQSRKTRQIQLAIPSLLLINTIKSPRHEPFLHKPSHTTQHIIFPILFSLQHWGRRDHHLRFLQQPLVVRIIPIHSFPSTWGLNHLIVISLLNVHNVPLCKVAHLMSRKL